MDITRFRDYSKLGKTKRGRVDSLIKFLTKMNLTIINVEKSQVSNEEFAYIHFNDTKGKSWTLRVNNSGAFWIYSHENKVDDDSITTLREMKSAIKEMVR